MEQVILKKKINYPIFARFESRLATFNTTTLPQDSFLYKMRKEFADAGFFYAGEDDKTICYYCGGGLRDWEDTNHPWKEHARWFGRCPYLLILKGRDFVKQHINRDTSHPVEIAKETNEKPITEENTFEGRECIVCLSAEKDLLFLPCKHCCTCSSCGLMYNNCVFCRTPITSLVKIFIV